MELVTAVITTHKREPNVVERALQSILAQTYSNMEIIVVDDSPCDYELRNKIKTMVECYKDKNVQYIQHERCQGACAARNTGLALAKGEYIAFLDDDDEWFPEKIEKQLKGFVNKDIALVYCGVFVINDDTGIRALPERKFYRGKVYDRLILSNFIGSTSFPLIRTECLLEIGGFDVLMQSAQDYDVWLRLAQKYEIEYVEEALALYHNHIGVRISRTHQRRVNGLERVREKHKEYLKKNGYARWFVWIRMVPEYAANGQKGKAWRTWLKYAFKRPFYIKENLRSFYHMLLAFQGKW